MILVLVFIGSALTAAGGLYFINIKFCKDPVQAIAMLLGGLVMVAGGEIAVTGSSTSFFKAQQIQTSACELEGETAHPTDRRDDFSGRVIFKHIVGCMKTAGYMWTNEHKHCQDAPVATPTHLLSSRRNFGTRDYDRSGSLRVSDHVASSKMGQHDIRRLLIIGAMAVIRWVSRKGAPEAHGFSA